MLNEGIQWGIRRETGGVIDFQQQWFKVFSDEDIEAQNMKAHIARILLGLAVTVLVTHQGRIRQQSFDNGFIYLCF